MLKNFNELTPEEQYPQLLVLVGLQGSGKSTFANKEDIKNNYIIFYPLLYNKFSQNKIKMQYFFDELE